MTIPADRLTYTAEEAAQLLGLSLRGVQDACSSGSIPAVKIAGKWLVPAHTLYQRLGVPLPAANNADYRPTSTTEADEKRSRAARMLIEAAVELLGGSANADL